MLKDKVKKMIKKHHLLDRNDSVLVGVSGGPDSLALLHVLLSMREEYMLHLTVAHVDHMFRGQESFEDYMFVEQFCGQHRIPFRGVRLNVPKYIKETGKSPQVSARDLRYGFFKQVMEEEGIRKLALAHHADDQTETILMRLTRGASGKARAGIAVQRAFGDGMIIRPFLGVSKSVIESYCKAEGLKARIDPSNGKDTYLRNRFRRNVLPFLKRENPKVHEHFQRFSEECLEDEHFLMSLAEKELLPLWHRDKDFSSVPISSFLAMSKPLQRRSIQLILNYLYFERHEELSAVHIDSILQLFEHPQPSGEVHLPGDLKVIKSYDTASFRFSEEWSGPYSLPILIPGETALPNGKQIHTRFVKGDYKEFGNDSFLLKAETANLPLSVRTRMDGDRMTVKGLSGSKKIKDIFIDGKIPVSERSIWPIVEDCEGSIIWVPGLKKSAFEAESDQGSFIILKYV